MQEVETDRAHVTEEARSDPEASTLLEPTGSAKVRKTKNELAEKRGGRGEERRKDPERAENLSKEQNPLALLRRGPMLWKRAIGSNHHHHDIHFDLTAMSSSE
jgi:hypothetical protein